MARRPRWHHMVMASQAEALTAVELHNSPVTARPLESYFVHMHLAWLYLVHAEFERDGIDYHYRDKATRRYVRIDGDKKSWDLEKCVKERFPNASDSVRLNLDVTIKLRNKIEHRWERGLMVASYGFTQSLMINYEEELVAQFGPQYSIADRVHLPVSLSTFSREGAAAMARAQKQLPKPLREFFIDYRASLSDEVLTDRQFEFRIEIIQKRAPKSEADLAIEFVRWDDLSQEDRQAYAELEKTGRVIVREKEVQVPDKREWLSPGDLAAIVEAGLGVRFMAAAEFPKAWKHYNVRPGTDATGDARKVTDERYCRYVEEYDKYSYTREFAELIIEECCDPDVFEMVIGWAPKPPKSTGVQART